MTVPSPIHLGRMQVVLGALIESWLPSPASVIWAHQQRPREASEAIQATLKIKAGPSPIGPTTRRMLRTPTTAVLTVAAATAGARAWLEINDVVAVADVEVGDDVTELRDRWLDAIELIAEDAGITAVAQGAAAIAIAPIVAGGIYRLRTSPADTITVAVGPLAAFEYVEGTHRIAVELQIKVRRTVGAAQSPRNGATDLFARVMHGLGEGETADRLELDGLGLDAAGVPVDLTEISGGETESRGALDLEVLAQGVSWRSKASIGRVEVEITASPDHASTPGPFVVEADDPTP